MMVSQRSKKWSCIPHFLEVSENLDSQFLFQVPHLPSSISTLSLALLPLNKMRKNRGKGA